MDNRNMVRPNVLWPNQPYYWRREKRVVTFVRFGNSPAMVWCRDETDKPLYVPRHELYTLRGGD